MISLPSGKDVPNGLLPAPGGLDAGDDLPHAVIGHDLEDTKLGLLPRIQQWIDIAQKFLLVGLKIRVGGIEFAGQAFEFVFGAAALDCLAELIQSSGSALADLESILNELLQEGQDLGKDFVADFGLLLELAHVKTENGVLQQSTGNTISLFSRIWLWLCLFLGKGQSCGCSQHQ